MSLNKDNIQIIETALFKSPMLVPFGIVNNCVIIHNTTFLALVTLAYERLNEQGENVEELKDILNGSFEEHIKNFKENDLEKDALVINFLI